MPLAAISNPEGFARLAVSRCWAACCRSGRNSRPAGVQVRRGGQERDRINIPQLWASPGAIASADSRSGRAGCRRHGRGVSCARSTAPARSGDQVLPAAFQRSAPERRFEREARAAASLSHPNIVAVHDLGLHRGASFIVTELLDGESLRQRLRDKPLPVRQAIDFAVRSPRPCRRPRARHRSPRHQTRQPVRDVRGTHQDSRLRAGQTGQLRCRAMRPRQSLSTAWCRAGDGTAMYMSPEQARGLSIDHRSDILSFGGCCIRCWPGFHRSVAVRQLTP